MTWCPFLLPFRSLHGTFTFSFWNKDVLANNKNHVHYSMCVYLESWLVIMTYLIDRVLSGTRMKLHTSMLGRFFVKNTLILCSAQNSVYQASHCSALLIRVCKILFPSVYPSILANIRRRRCNTIWNIKWYVICYVIYNLIKTKI